MILLMARTKNPQLTRLKLLEAAFEEVYEHGFRGAGLEAILSRAGVTKGALYHHFPNKNALGYALVDELIGGWMASMWLSPLRDADDPIGVLQDTISGLKARCDQTRCDRGCPLNNLAQEMSGEDEEFRLRIAAVIERLTTGIAAALRRGQQAGTVRAGVDAGRTAGFIFAAVEGIAGVSKNAQSLEVLNANMDALSEYLESLRPRRAA
jgi:AcrR family transcriptional regulator